MKDIAARELKGHNILAVERFWDSTFWMIEFTVLRPTAYGEPGDEMRLFLTEDGYQSALQSQQRREIKIKRYAHVIEGHNLDMIGHDPHELAAVLSAVLQGYTRHSAQAELDRVFDAQYQLNMLKITSDGRKLGLDQRIVNQMLPDEPGTKVNQCVDNIMQIWRDGKADKLTQLVFCDISTPQAKAPASKAAKTLDNQIVI